MIITKFKLFKESMENTNHTYYLPTYDECRQICDANGNLLFYETKHELDGYDVSIFNYRLAYASHFNNPIESKDIKAHELRGLTFVFNKDGSLYKRFLLLDKFWNMNQTECSMYSVIKNYKIKNIYTKEDGSIASFIKLPNGRVFGKSKTSFISDQALEIQKIYQKWPNIKKFIDWTLDNDIIAIFEYVSPTNRIVVPYANTDLILLRLRDNNTGEYLDIDNFHDKLDGISVAQNIKGLTLDDLVELKSVENSKEGWIVQFENGKMIKIKTEWYSSLHRLYTEEVNRENTLIKLIIDEKIDDIMPELDQTKIDEIKDISNIINNYIIKAVSEIDELMEKFDGDVRKFAIENRKEKWFFAAMKIINKNQDKVEIIKEFILEKTQKLQAARYWLDQNR